MLARWYSRHCHAIHIRNRGFPRTSTQRRADNDFGEEEQSNGRARAIAGGPTTLGGSSYPTKVPSEGTYTCIQSSFMINNVFDVLQDVSESIRGSCRQQLDAADGLTEPITHDLHQSLIELLERPEILSLHAVRRVGRKRQLHLKIRALCGELRKVLNVLVHTAPRCPGQFTQGWPTSARVSYDELEDMMSL